MEGGIDPPFLTSALDGDEWAVSRPSRFTIEERTCGTHWIGGWVGSSADLDVVKQETKPCPCRE
jgi:hypothetical protein